MTGEGLVALGSGGCWAARVTAGGRVPGRLEAGLGGESPFRTAVGVRNGRSVRPSPLPANPAPQEPTPRNARNAAPRARGAGGEQKGTEATFRTARHGHAGLPPVPRAALP